MRYEVTEELKVTRHYSVKARSEKEAIDIVNQGYTEWLDEDWETLSINAEENECEREALEKWEHRLANPAKVTGYLLEFQRRDGTWEASEFDPLEESNIWGDELGLGTEWCDCEIGLGFYSVLGENTWVNSSCDWEHRLGVNFDARYTPTEQPHESGIWGGVVADVGSQYGELWRVRKVTIDETFSEKAKIFFRAHPLCTWITDLV